MDPVRATTSAQSADPDTLTHLFGSQDLLAMWIAEPQVAVAPEVQTALATRAGTPWYGYEVRPDELLDAFWSWAVARHGWAGSGTQTLVSPSIGTSIGVLVDRLTSAGDGVVIQPPVFTDFKPLVAGAQRQVLRNALLLGPEGYTMDLEGLARASDDPSARMLILCNPHNPVGRAWTHAELHDVAMICAARDIVVVADEIHADLMLPGGHFVPFAVAAAGSGVRWAALHGPIKTFGLAGVCDTLLITPDADIAAAFKDASNRFHLTRNNVFGMAAAMAGYRHGHDWVDDLMHSVSTHHRLLAEGLAHGLQVMPQQATYMAWLDLRALGLPVPDIAGWLGDAGVALSPGHWFGREGAGFTRMTTAVPTETMIQAIARLNAAAT